MKRAVILLVLILSSLLVPSQADAQGGDDVITLNDATPGIDVVITLPPDTTGAVILEVQGAAVQLTDHAGNIVFSTTDLRVQGLELRFAPNADAHTLSIERLPGVPEAYAIISSQIDLTETGSGMLVSNDTLQLQQESDAVLDLNAPSHTMNVSTPTPDPVAITATFPGAGVTWQLVDESGMAVATLYAGQIDGISMVLDGGDYQVSMLNSTPSEATVANVRVMPATNTALASAMPATATPATTTSTTALCTTTIAVSSINMRSGPGTGYSVLQYGYRGEEFMIGGTNPIGNWLLIALPNGGSAWMARDLGSEQGSCNELAVYNIPTRDAPTPAVVIQTIPGSDASSPGFFDDDDDDHDDDDDDDDDD